MASNLNDAEYFIDTITDRVRHILNERNNLRRELSRNFTGNIEREKDFVRTYQDGIINSAFMAEKISRLEHMLSIR